MVVLFVSVLHLCRDLVLCGQSRHAHEVNGASQVTYSWKCLVVLTEVEPFLSFRSVCRRSNLRGLYKGDVYNLYNSVKTVSPSKPAVVCWMGLAGYQAAVVCLGNVHVNVR